MRWGRVGWGGVGWSGSSWAGLGLAKEGWFWGGLGLAGLTMGCGGAGVGWDRGRRLRWGRVRRGGVVCGVVWCGVEWSGPSPKGHDLESSHCRVGFAAFFRDPDAPLELQLWGCKVYPICLQLKHVVYFFKCAQVEERRERSEHPAANCSIRVGTHQPEAREHQACVELHRASEEEHEDASLPVYALR